MIFNPFDFGPCDGNGPQNGERKYYYSNGSLQTIGIVKNCLWQGLVINYSNSGDLESIANYKDGMRSGLTEYFTKETLKWREEDFINDSLIEFQISDLSDGSTFHFKRDTLKFASSNKINFVFFAQPIVMSGNDEPFTSIRGGKLLMRGNQDFYVVNKMLLIEMNLRDTLMKYIPSAYNENTDKSGNKYSFLWHRDICGDTLKVKVFYDGDNHQSNFKTWEAFYIL